MNKPKITKENLRELYASINSLEKTLETCNALAINTGNMPEDLKSTFIDLNKSYDSAIKKLEETKEKAECDIKQHVRSKINAYESEITSLEKSGADVSEAKNITKEADKFCDAGKFLEAINLIKNSNRFLYKALFLKLHNDGLYTMDAACQTGISMDTARKYLKQAGLETRHKPSCANRISEEKEQKILEAHELGMYISKAAAFAGVSKNAVSTYLRKHGLEPHKYVGGGSHKPSKLNQEKRADIVKAYVLDMDPDEAAAFAGVKVATVNSNWKKAGFVFPPRVLIPDELLDRLIEAYFLDMTKKDAAAYAGVSDHSVSRYWDLYGLKTIRHGGQLSKEEEQKIIDAYNQGMSKYKICISTGHNGPVVKKVLEKNGLTIKNNQRLEKIRITELLDCVFDVVNNPDELVTLDEIRERLGISNKPIDENSLEQRLAEVVKYGFYEVVEKDGKICYKAGMPSAMDGMVKGD